MGVDCFIVATQNLAFGQVKQLQCGAGSQALLVQAIQSSFVQAQMLQSRHKSAITSAADR